MSWLALFVILFLVAVAILGRTVPAWHNAIVNFFSFLAYVFAGTSFSTAGTA